MKKYRLVNDYPFGNLIIKKGTELTNSETGNYKLEFAGGYHIFNIALVENNPHLFEEVVEFGNYITRDEDNKLYLNYNCIADMIKTNGVWHCSRCPFGNIFDTCKISQIDSSLFPEVTWEDEKPTKIILEK